MLSNFLHFGKGSLAIFLALSISGCAADRYFMVQKQDLKELNTSVLDQNNAIKSLDTQSREHLETLIHQTETTRQDILTAIAEKVEKPSCPPVPEQPSCEITEERPDDREGLTDRIEGKVIVGELEQFYLLDPGVIFEARIDSGAETSSMDARNITRFERDGQNWVRFDVPNPNGDDMITLEREISRRVRIIQSSTDEKERRVVVDLQFMIGNHRQQAEFTLTDRGHLSQRVLVGRNILRDVMLIDVGREFATELPESIIEGDGES